MLAQFRGRALLAGWCIGRTIQRAGEGTVSAKISPGASFELFEQCALPRKRCCKVVVFAGDILELRGQLSLRAKSAKLQVAHPASARFLGAPREVAKTGRAGALDASEAVVVDFRNAITLAIGALTQRRRLIGEPGIDAVDPGSEFALCGEFSSVDIARKGLFARGEAGNEFVKMKNQLAGLSRPEVDDVTHNRVSPFGGVHRFPR